MSNADMLRGYGRHQIDDDDIAAVRDVLKGNFLTTGPAVASFEAALADRLDVPYVVVCANGTAALHLACMALGLGEGDVGLVPAITFVATANALRYVGSDVAFVDVDTDTGLSNADDFQRTLSQIPAKDGRRGKVLMPVHLNGQCTDMEAIANLAAENDMAVIEDACHALGASYTDKAGNRHKVGACVHSDMAIFSFHPVKAIAAGEGGAIATRDETLYRRLLLLRSHGLDRNADHSRAAETGSLVAGDVGAPWYYELQELGFNYRLSDINAALGESQLKKLDRFLAARRELARTYNDLLVPLEPDVRSPPTRDGIEHAYHLYAARIAFNDLKISRADLMRRLAEKGIGTQVHYIPVPEQPYYRNGGALPVPRNGYPGAQSYYNSALSLPLHANIDPDQLPFVVDTLSTLIEELRSN